LKDYKSLFYHEAGDVVEQDWVFDTRENSYTAYLFAGMKREDPIGQMKIMLAELDKPYYVEHPRKESYDRARKQLKE